MKTTRGTTGLELQLLSGPIHRDAPGGTGRPLECTA
jgi:xanthine dehydrogenase accessory factor